MQKMEKSSDTAFDTATKLRQSLSRNEKKIIVFVPLIKTTMEINEKDFNNDWMVKIPINIKKN